MTTKPTLRAMPMREGPVVGHRPVVVMAGGVAVIVP
jgi:hypothetical protein